MKFLLCLKCRRAWIGPVAASCCGDQPLDCNPWSSDARAWYVVRTRDRATEIVEVAFYRDAKENRRSLLRGIRAKGNESFRGRAA